MPTTVVQTSGTGNLLASSDPKGVSFFYEPLAKFQPLIKEAFNEHDMHNISRIDFEKVYESEYECTRWDRWRWKASLLILR